jgi:glutaredoxin/glutathione-dependent peroxiredoxin
MKKISSIILPIVDNNKINNFDLSKLLCDKKVIIFGVPGAFTPTCSEQHLPNFLEFHNQIIDKGIDDIFCMSVNDPYVMKAWLQSYTEGYKIKGVADGNGDFSKSLNVITDKSKNFMGIRCHRFAIIVNNNIIEHEFFEDLGEFKKTSAENILKYL